MHTIQIAPARFVRDPVLTKGSEPSKDRVNFTVASDRRFGDKSDFFDCVMWGNRAAAIEKWCSKGSSLVIWGEPQEETYEDRNGIKRKSRSVVVFDWEFCGSRKNSGDSKPDEIPTGYTETIMDDCPF